MNGNDIARFMAKVERGDCWTWTGAHVRNGYGHFWLGRARIAHRVSYEHFVGPIPEGAMVCHSCDNPPCVRPDHLFLGTAKDNTRDAAVKGRLRGNPDAKGHGPGSAHPQSLLTDDIVREIRASSESQTTLARRYGVHRSTIASVKQRRSWTHI